MNWMDKMLAGRFAVTEDFVVVSDYLRRGEGARRELDTLVFEYLFDKTVLSPDVLFSDWLLDKAVEWKKEREKNGGDK